MVAAEFGVFQDGIGNDHRENASALLKVDVNAEPDAQNSTEVMSVRLVHAASPDDLAAGKLQATKLWMYRDEAINFAHLILAAAMNDAHPFDMESSKPDQGLPKTTVIN